MPWTASPPARECHELSVPLELWVLLEPSDSDEPHARRCGNRSRHRIETTGLKYLGLLCAADTMYC
jgi:hypothetical protein